MQSYPIHELERLTGIKAHTIRIWEKRYALIEPERTSTNRRYYSDTQVKKLLNVSTLLSQGYKISKIASLSEDEINTKIQTGEETESKDTICATYVNDLIKSMLSMEELAFEKIFSAASLRLGIFDTMVSVIYPFLSKIGILWTVDKTTPFQEHFASCIIRRKLMAATDGLLPASVAGKKYLLYLPSNEWHDIGLLFANYIIRAKGYETVYLGQNVPDESVIQIIQIAKPTIILLFFVATRPKEEAEKHVIKTAGVCPGSKVLVAGNRELFADTPATANNVVCLESVYHLLEFL
jgi:DNA-binding transcriptional MerR regulator